MLGKTLRALSALLAFAPIVAAADLAPMAAIDGKPALPVADVLYVYNRQYPDGGAVSNDEASQRLLGILNNLLIGEILRVEAEARGFGDDPAIKATIAGDESRYLREYYYNKLAAEVTVEEEAVRAFYDKGQTRRLFSFLNTDTEERAEEARAALEKGRPWKKVIKEYSTFKGYPNKDGTWPAPISYNGDAVTEALFALAPGEYTAVIPDTYGLSWSIYRSVKVVHGDGRSYEDARPDIIAAMRAEGVRRRIAELTAASRETAPIVRNPEIWEVIATKAVDELNQTYRGKGTAISTVGGVPVLFDDALEAVLKATPLGPVELEKLRQERPERYTAVWDAVTIMMEGDALLEHLARAEGALDDPAVRREFANRRTDLLIQKFYEADYLASLPAPTDEEIQEYYEAHKNEYASPERVEVYLAAMPDEKKLKAFYKKVKKGADMVLEGEARSRARMEAADAAVEIPPAVPPEKDEFYGTVIITTAPMEGEQPLAAELRPRAFPFKALNEPSEIFRLADGRWAFYTPIYHVEARQRGLDDPEVLFYSRKGVFTSRVQASDDHARAWIDALRAKHTVILDRGAFERALAALAQPASN